MCETSWTSSGRVAWTSWRSMSLVPSSAVRNRQGLAASADCMWLDPLQGRDLDVRQQVGHEERRLGVDDVDPAVAPELDERRLARRLQVVALRILVQLHGEGRAGLVFCRRLEDHPEVPIREAVTDEQDGG